MNRIIFSKINLSVYFSVVLCVLFLAWDRYTDDEMNVYISYANSKRELAGFGSVVFIGSVDDCGAVEQQNSDPILGELARANSIGNDPRDLAPIGHLVNVMKASDLKIIDNAKGRLNIRKLTGKDPIFLSRVAFDSNHDVAIMCVTNGHTRYIEMFKKQGFSQWVIHK